MAKRKGTKSQTMVYKILFRKVKTRTPLKHGMTDAPEEYDVPAPLVAPVMSHLLHIS